MLTLILRRAFEYLMTFIFFILLAVTMLIALIFDIIIALAWPLVFLALIFMLFNLK
jgi:hypothetical protein